jgi:hypothetical protein
MDHAKQRSPDTSPADPQKSAIPANDALNAIDQQKTEEVELETIPTKNTTNSLQVFSKQEEDAVIRKLDWHLMPLIFLLYSLSVLDRSNLGNARLAGLTKDIDLSGRRYDWLATVFYISCESFHLLTDKDCKMEKLKDP